MLFQNHKCVPIKHGIRISKGFSKSATHTTLESGKPPHSNPFPYPEHRHPTPQQIFHLPFGATQKQIKSRYYELVRVHHPDSKHAAHLSPEIAHDRFRSIKASYDFLCGRTLSPHPNSKPAPTPKHFDPHLHELAKRRRAHYASRGYTTFEEEIGGVKPGWADGFGAPKNQQREWNENGWRERLILSFGVVILLAGLFPNLPSTVISMILPSSHTGSLAAPLDDSTPFRRNFIPDINKNHRAAVSSLTQARQERREVGTERRDGVRQRVREMDEAGAATNCDYGETK